MIKENLSSLEQIIPRGEVGMVVNKWAESLTPTPGDEARQFENKSNIFNEAKMDRLAPATDINFWLKYGVRYWEKLDGEVLGKTGVTQSRDHFKISSQLAHEAAEKVSGGEEIKSLSKAEQVSMLVLTKAKLLAAEKMATNVYSELRSDFEAAKKEVDKGLTNLLVDKEKVTDVNNDFDWHRVIPAGKLAVPILVTVASLILAACSTPAEARPTGETPAPATAGVTETVPASPTATATATEVVPTEVPISYEIPYTAEGKIDFDKIVNETPTSREDWKNIKEELLSRNTGVLPICNIGINRDLFAFTEIMFDCHAAGGVISPGLLSRDESGNIVMTFLGTFRDKTNTTYVPILLNVAVTSDMDKYKQSIPGRNPLPDIWSLPWGKGNRLYLLVAGDRTEGYAEGIYSEMDKILANYTENMTDEAILQMGLLKVDIDTDSSVFAALLINERIVDY